MNTRNEAMTTMRVDLIAELLAADDECETSTNPVT